MFSNLNERDAMRILTGIVLVPVNEASDLIVRAEHKQGQSIPLLITDSDDVVEDIKSITFTGDGYTINLN